MAPETVFWSLLHIESKTQIDSLTFAQASLLVASFNESELMSWAGWYEGLAEWQSVDELLTILRVPSKLKLAPVANKHPPFTGTTNSGNLAAAPVAETAATSFAASFATSPAASPTPVMAETMVTVTGSGILAPDARLAKRFQKKYKAFVQTKAKMHETQTVDMSLTGLQILDGLPSGSDGPFEVTLVNHKGESLQLICSVIADEKRTRMKIVRAAKLDQLHGWLLNTAD